MLIDLIKENGITLKKGKSSWYPTKTITDADYADDIALLANTPTQAESLMPAWSRQQEALVSTWMQTKWSTCFNQEELSGL